MSAQKNGTAPVGRRNVLKIMAGVAAGSVALRESSTVNALPLTLDLSRGVNLSHWFAQSLEGYSEQHFTTFVTRDDIRRIAAAGFSHVRLPFEPDIVFTSGNPPALQEDIVGYLLNAINMIRSENLSIVLDMHPVGASKNQYLTPQGADSFVTSWTLLAKRLAGVDPLRMAFEILNEPDPLSGNTWWQLQDRAIAAIRREDPARPLIANGGAWSGVGDLVSQTPYNYPGLIYTIHHYDPVLFTLQGATWTWDVAARIHDLPWPVAPADAVQVSQQAASSESDQQILGNQITDGVFTERFLSDNFDRLAAWAAQHGKPPIYVGEFGVYTKNAPQDSRLRWLTLARQTFQKHGWNWALWDDGSDFGFLAPGSNHEIDPLMLQALGMHRI